MRRALVVLVVAADTMLAEIRHDEGDEGHEPVPFFRPRRASARVLPLGGDGIPSFWRESMPRGCSTSGVLNQSSGSMLGVDQTHVGTDEKR